jgi:hypothetical protein
MPTPTPPNPRVLNKRRHGIPDGAVYIGRPSKWGNPFEIGKHGNRAQVISRYERWLRDNTALMAALPELRGKNLVCWCSPAPCHGDILLALANGLPLPRQSDFLTTLENKPPTGRTLPDRESLEPDDVR